MPSVRSRAWPLTSAKTSSTVDDVLAGIDLTGRNVIITGGHLPEPTDMLSSDAGGKIKYFTGTRFEGRSTHGTGCAFSAAVACNLAKRKNLSDSAAAAKHYVFMALKNAKAIGKGRGPIEHLYR